jgi:hypothetical protein
MWGFGPMMNLWAALGVATPVRALNLRNTISVFLVCYFSILAGISVFYFPTPFSKKKKVEYEFHS